MLSFFCYSAKYRYFSRLANQRNTVIVLFIPIVQKCHCSAIHKNTKGMDACASSYIMYGNVNKRLPVFAIGNCHLDLYMQVRIPVPGRIAEQWHFCTIGQKAQWQYFSDWPAHTTPLSRLPSPQKKWKKKTKEEEKCHLFLISVFLSKFPTVFK